MNSFRDWAEFYKVLGDPTRLRLLALLAQEPHCVCELVGFLGLSQPTISHHLSRLRYAGLIREERRGQWIFYSVVTNRVSFWTELVTALPGVANEPQARPTDTAIACQVGNIAVEDARSDP